MITQTTERIQEKILSLWTDKHDEYCLQEKIPPAAQYLWRWLLREGKVGTEVEPDLKEFNNEIAKKRGNPYSHNYLKEMFNLLCQKRVINIIKTFSWRFHRILVRPLDWLKPRRKKTEKNLQNHNESYKTGGSNPQSADGGYNSSSILTTEDMEHLEVEHQRQQEVLNACAEYGIYFNPEKQPEAVQHDIEDVRCALQHFMKRGGHTKDNFNKPRIPNPQGWLIDCLRNRYWEDDNLQLDGFLGFMARFTTLKPK